MTHTRGVKIPSAGENVSNASPGGERIGGLLLLVAVSSILFSGEAGYWLWVTEHHDKAIIAWIITISLFVTIMGLGSGCCGKNAATRVSTGPCSITSCPWSLCCCPRSPAY